MGRLSFFGRRRRERPARVEQPAMAQGFGTRQPSPWGDDEHEAGEAGLRRRHGRGTNYLVIDQFGPNGGPGF